MQKAVTQFSKPVPEKFQNQRDPNVIRVHKFSESHISQPFDNEAYGVPAGSTAIWPNLNPNYEFVKVINEGTKEFTDMDLMTDFDALDLTSLAEHVLGKNVDADRNRSNKQMNLGWSGGENVQRRDAEIHNHYGSSMNQMNEGTLAFKHLFVQMSNIARKLGIPWTAPSDCQLFRERNSIYAKSLDPKNVFEGITVALLELVSGDAKVSKHKDVSNDIVLSETLVCNGIVQLGDTLYRVSVIAYMRKACGDSVLRRKACRETAEATLGFLGSLEESRLPIKNSVDYSGYFNSVGEMGLALLITEPTRTEDTYKVHFGALLTRPHLDKPFGFLSPVSDVISRIYEKNGHMTQTDVLALCLPCAHLNGFFTYLAGLHSLLSRPVLLPEGPLGYLGTLINEMLLSAGSYASGSLPRCQVWFNHKSLDVARTLQDLDLIQEWCSSSSEEIPAGVPSYEAHCRDALFEVTSKMKDRIRFCGMFGAHHLVHVLAQLKMFRPVGVLNFARFATNTTTLVSPEVEPATKNPWMIRYLNNGCGKTSHNSRMDRAKSIMDGVVAHLKHHHRVSYMNSSILEQSNCEMNRDNIAVDMTAVHGSSYNLTPDGLHRVTCSADDGTGQMGFAVSVPAPPEARPQQPTFPSGGGTWESVSVKSKNKSNRKCARIPLEYLLSFEGLLEDVRKVFFPSSPGSLESTALKTLEDNPILRSMALHFARKPQPLQKDLDFLEGSGKPAAKRTGRKSPEDFAYLSPARFKGSPPTQARKKKVRSVSFGPNVSVSPSVVLPTKKTPPPASAAIAPTVLSMHDTVLNAVTVHGPSKQFGLTQLQNLSFCDAMSRKRYPELTSSKKVAALAKNTSAVALGSIFVVAKAALFFGVEDSKVELSFSGDKLVTEAVNMNTASLLDNQQGNPSSSRGKLFRAIWEEDQLPFCRANTCALVDYIATNHEGHRLKINGQPGRVDWAFPSREQAASHFMLCLVLAAGKPQFFHKILLKAWRMVAKENPQPGSTYAVPVNCETWPKREVLFYVVFQPRARTFPGRKKKKRKQAKIQSGSHQMPSDQEWHLCLLPWISGDRKPPPLRLLDVWTWKVASELGPVLPAEESESDQAQSNGPSRRKRKRRKKEPTRKKEPKENREETTNAAFYPLGEQSPVPFPHELPSLSNANIVESDDDDEPRSYII